jgi:hypothetical protein
MSWTAQQAQLLSAMGLEPMRLREAGETLRREPPAADRPRPAAPSSRPIPGSLAPTASHAPPASRPGLLLEALRRAAGGRDIGELVADLERLRREPALKRALWPRLRALRRH